MTSVGVYERITITKHGVPVAMLVPAGARPPRPVPDVIAELRAFGRGRRLGVSRRRAIASGRR